MRYALLILVFVVGCAAEGTPITTWRIADGSTLSVPGHVPVEESHGDVVLDASVPLSASQRGTALALVVDCFHAPLLLSAGGTRVAGVGNAGPGSWRFEIPSELTGGTTLDLKLTVPPSSFTILGFGVAPRLVDDPHGDPRFRAVEAFNLYTSIAAVLVLVIIGLAYAAIYLLDRRRIEYLAILAYGITVLNVPLLVLGVYQDVFGRWAPHASFLMALVNYASLLYAIHYILRSPPVRRGWLWLFGALALALVASAAAPKISTILFFLNGPLTLVVNGYVYVTMLRVARGRSEYRFDARISLVAATFSAVCLLLGAAWTITGKHLIAGFHPLPLGVLMTYVVQTIVLARQHVIRQRQIETTNLELRRQVAERSRELGDALAKLSQQPAPPAEPGNVDLPDTVDGKRKPIDPALDDTVTGKVGKAD